MIAPLRPIFHRSVPAPGNSNTVNAAKFEDRKNRDSTVIESIGSGNLKMLVQLAKDPKDDVSMISIDTGQNGNPFQLHYFDLNEDHLAGRLKPMKWTAEKIEGTPV